MRSRFVTISVAVFSSFAIALAGCQSNPKSSVHKTDMQAEVDDSSAKTLATLYAVKPKAEEFIRGAAGYATFTNFGLKILVAGGGSGEGVAVNNSTGQKTYMRMVQVNAGLGWQAQKFRLIWVFTTQEALDNFINKGRELSANASAAAAVDSTGAGADGSLAIGPGVYLFQLTDTGVALQLTAQGTKYYKDEGLN
jgi:lipid-binding SYLF domain-containing protein